MIIVSMFRVMIDMTILFLFLSLTNPRQDQRNPYCALLQYSAVPFAARLFPDFVTLGTISYYEKPYVNVVSIAKPPPLKLVLPLRPDEINGRNMTSAEEFLLSRDNSFKYFLNITLLVFMYLGTLLCWVAVGKAHSNGTKVETGKMRRTYCLLLYFCLCFSWLFCNTNFMKNSWNRITDNKYYTSIAVNIVSWTFLVISIKVCVSCLRLLPPRTSTQCILLQHYISILNVTIWYSFLAVYFTYSFYRPSREGAHRFNPFYPIDENTIVSFLFLTCIIFSPPYRYRFPLPNFFSSNHNIRGGLPSLQTRLRAEERLAKKNTEVEQMVLQMDDNPPAYEDV